MIVHDKILLIGLVLICIGCGVYMAQQGAPANFGGRVISPAKVFWDTEANSKTDNPTSGKLSIENYKGTATKDISVPNANNDEANGGMYKEHPIEQFTKKSKEVRHPLGHSIPSAKIKEYDN